MQLNKFTDYALRVVLYIAPSRELPYTISEVATALHVSENHLIKVVHFMAKQHWLMTTRGKGGGIRLNPQSLTLKLGDIVQTLQGDHQVVNCLEPSPCILLKTCGLKSILNQAMQQFYQSLNQYTLADVVNQPTKIALLNL